MNNAKIMRKKRLLVKFLLHLKESLQILHRILVKILPNINVTFYIKTTKNLGKSNYTISK